MRRSHFNKRRSLVELGLLLRTKAAEEHLGESLEIARAGVVVAAERLDRCASLIALQVTTVGTLHAHLAGLCELDSLGETLVGFVLWHWKIPKVGNE